MDELIARGGLRVAAGRILAMRETDDAVAVTWRARGHGGTHTDHVAAIVNCTGPAGDVRDLDDPLISSILRSGLAQSDATRLGFQVTDEYALVGTDGVPNPRVSLVGPFLKSRYWEATAVPELRVHAARLAEQLVERLGLTLRRRTA